MPYLFQRYRQTPSYTNKQRPAPFSYIKQLYTNWTQVFAVY